MSQISNNFSQAYFFCFSETAKKLALGLLAENTHYMNGIVCLQAKIGQEKKFEATLQRLRGKNVDISEEVSEIKVTFQIHVLIGRKSSYKDFKAPFGLG